MTTYSLGDRVQCLVASRGWCDAEVIEDRGDRVRVVITNDKGATIGGPTKTVVKSRIRPIPVKTSPKRAQPGDGMAAVHAHITGEAQIYQKALHDTMRSAFAPKSKPWRSKAYLRYIRQQSGCACCCRVPTPDDPMEASHHGAHGMGTKSDDSRAIPLRKSCRAYYHQHGTFRTFSRSETDACAESAAVRLLMTWCTSNGRDIDVDRIILDALTDRLRDL